MENPIQKVLAYITRERDGRVELLVFDHVDAPEAGTQVPAGSIDPGESPLEAAVREAFEEVGVDRLTLVRVVGRFPFLNPVTGRWHERHVHWFKAPSGLPERWVHTVSDGVDDKGMRFECFWIDAAEAVTALSGQQGEYLREMLR